MAKTLLDLAREAVALAPKCQCGRVATARYSDPLVAAECCGQCCGAHVLAAADTLGPEETYSVAPLPEGKRAVEVARAYGIEGAE